MVENEHDIHAMQTKHVISNEFKTLAHNYQTCVCVCAWTLWNSVVLSAIWFSKKYHSKSSTENSENTKTINTGTNFSLWIKVNKELSELQCVWCVLLMTWPIFNEYTIKINLQHKMWRWKTNVIFTMIEGGNYM